MLTPLIVLANSWKHHDYCIAGINPETGRWLRPVSDLNDGRIAKDAMQLDGYFPQLMDVIEISGSSERTAAFSLANGGCLAAQPLPI